MKHNQSEDTTAYTHTQAHTHTDRGKQERAWYCCLWVLVVRSERGAWQARFVFKHTQFHKKQAVTVTYSQDKQVCHSHFNSKSHSVVCVCPLFLAGWLSCVWTGRTQRPGSEKWRTSWLSFRMNWEERMATRRYNRSLSPNDTHTERQGETISPYYWIS